MHFDPGLDFDLDLELDLALGLVLGLDLGHKEGGSLFRCLLLTLFLGLELDFGGPGSRIGPHRRRLLPTAIGLLHVHEDSPVLLFLFF